MAWKGSSCLVHIGSPQGFWRGWAGPYWLLPREVTQAWLLIQIPWALDVGSLISPYPLGLPWLRFDSHPNTVMHRVRVYTALYPREVQILSQGYVPLTCVHLLSGNSLHIWEVRNSSLFFTEVCWGTVKEPTFVLFFYPTNSGSFNLLRLSVWCHWSIYFTLFINEKWKGAAGGPGQLVSIIWLIRTQNENITIAWRQPEALSDGTWTFCFLVIWIVESIWNDSTWLK